MITYIEPNLGTRRVFFLAVVLFGVLAFAMSQLEDLLPPLSSDPLQALDQSTDRLLIATILNTFTHIVISVVAVYLTQRAVQSRQWPPKGMNVPFRTRVTEIKRPMVAWSLLVMVLSIFVAQVSTRVVFYTKFLTITEEAKKAFEVPPNNKFNRTSGSLRPFGRLT